MNPTGIVEGTTLCLHRGAPARLERARGRRLRVESGCVWITRARCRDDVVVSAGETYTIDRDGTTVVSSLDRRAALVTIEAPAPTRPKPSLAERLGKLCRGLHLRSTPAPAESTIDSVRDVLPYRFLRRPVG